MFLNNDNALGFICRNSTYEHNHQRLQL